MAEPRVVRAAAHREEHRVEPVGEHREGRVAAHPVGHPEEHPVERVEARQAVRGAAQRPAAMASSKEQKNVMRETAMAQPIAAVPRVARSRAPARSVVRRKDPVTSRTAVMA